MNREQFRTAFVSLSPSRQELLIRVLEDLLKETKPEALARLQEGRSHEIR